VDRRQPLRRLSKPINRRVAARPGFPSSGFWQTGTLDALYWTMIGGLSLPQPTRTAFVAERSVAIASVGFHMRAEKDFWTEIPFTVWASIS